MPTLTQSEILMDVLQAFKRQFPALNRMGTDFRADALKLNQTYTAHIAGLPSIADYDAAQGGYKNGATSARGLLTDVPVTVNRHKHVPLKWAHLDNIKDRKNQYDQVVANAGYVLAKAIMDDILAGVTAANFSKELTYTVANSDLDMVEAANTAMNKNGAMPNGRILLVNSDVATVIGADSRVGSKDYAGQMTGGNSYRRFAGIGGFAEVIEYPDLPTNAQAALTSVTGTHATDVLTKNGHGLLNGEPIILTFGSGFTGLTSGNRYFVRDSADNTFKVATTRGGAAVDFSADGTGATVTPCAMTAFAFESRAIALLAGIPEQFSSTVAAQLGVPQVMGFETVTDPDSGLTMAAVSWQEAGTGDFYWSPTIVWGRSLGAQAGAVDSLTDKAGLRVLST